LLEERRTGLYGSMMLRGLAWFCRGIERSSRGLTVVLVLRGECVNRSEREDATPLNEPGGLVWSADVIFVFLLCRR
jgi:hypothetical protein